MQIVLVANPKGGAGKSSTSVGMAGVCASMGLRTCLVDCDSPQHTAAAWIYDSKDITVERCADSYTYLGGILESWRDDDRYDVVLIDTPARDADATWAAAAVADILLVPLTPCMADFSAAATMLRRQDQLWPATRRLVITNGYPSPKFMNEILPHALRLGVPICNTRISRRTAVPRAQMYGKPVTAFEPRGAAAEEFTNLTREVLNLWPTHQEKTLSPTLAAGLPT